ncbi:serine/threonine protein kinase [Lentzea sp. NBRC 105346]|uniref:serine/threonine-protein kinase n=1 Tax=Lentzea sp. NBRC 105346 TaxID=3032205 RepID=UPI0024A0D25C|nr:serine/threonine-protein kinase [Lentzea sp. NBRC 105346]GLZ27993.1 serine/threonine protein kinase [Lentzea sp. NBRC 105346]
MEQRVIAGRYTLVVELGRGAMGVVWRAHDQVLGRALAIKELLPPEGLRADERAVMQERMLREARTAGKLNDSAVVTVHDVIVEHGRTYLAMELVDAANLGALVARHGPLDSVAVANIALQALGALECAHAAGVVHRDVKPSNIMVRPDGMVKLTDFGIAQTMDDPRLTSNGGLIGSPAYMSPERLSGWEASPASDLWALGASIAYAVEGVAPFERPTTAATLHAIMNEPPVPTRASAAMAEVILGLLADDPSQRLTAARAREMLTAIVHGTGPVSVSRPPRRTPALARVAAVVAGVAVLAVSGVVGYQLLPRNAFGLGQAASPTEPDSGGVASPPESPGEPIPANQTSTFGRDGDVPGLNLSGTACAQGFLTKGRQVATSSPCDAPHDIQLYAAATPLFDKPKSIDYPGTQWLSDFGTKYCADQFPAAKAAERESFGVAVLVPTDREWAAWNDPMSPGHQEILCVAWKTDRTPLTASLVS